MRMRVTKPSPSSYLLNPASFASFPPSARMRYDGGLEGSPAPPPGRNPRLRGARRKRPSMKRLRLSCPRSPGPRQPAVFRHDTRQARYQDNILYRRHPTLDGKPQSGPPSGPPPRSGRRKPPSHGEFLLVNHRGATSPGRSTASGASFISPAQGMVCAGEKAHVRCEERMRFIKSLREDGLRRRTACGRPEHTPSVTGTPHRASSASLNLRALSSRGSR